MSSARALPCPRLTTSLVRARLFSLLTLEPAVALRAFSELLEELEDGDVEIGDDLASDLDGVEERLGAQSVRRSGRPSG